MHCLGHLSWLKESAFIHRLAYFRWLRQLILEIFFQRLTFFRQKKKKTKKIDTKDTSYLFAWNIIISWRWKLSYFINSVHRNEHCMRIAKPPGSNSLNTYQFLCVAFLFFSIFSTVQRMSLAHLRCAPKKPANGCIACVFCRKKRPICGRWMMDALSLRPVNMIEIALHLR